VLERRSRLRIPVAHARVAECLGAARSEHQRVAGLVAGLVEQVKDVSLGPATKNVDGAPVPLGIVPSARRRTETTSLQLDRWVIWKDHPQG
jgi:hypothetical protein